MPVGIGEETAHEGDAVDVCYVVPPVMSVSFPSMGASVLKACLERAGISCCIDYANVAFDEAFGEDLPVIFQHGLLEPVVEYLFNGPAGIENGITAEGAIDALVAMRTDMYAPNAESLRTAQYRTRARAAIEKGIAVACEHVDATARRVLARGPKIVGCTSTFAQRNAALAILRRIKQLNPQVITAMGGFNVSGAAGLATLRQFKYVDCVFFGESDDIVADAMRKLMADDTQDMPYGVIMNSDALPENAPHRIVGDLDDVPAPNFDDYVALPHPSGLSLSAECSRGCWWGQMNPCTFCGVCGKTRTYRSKSPERVVSELADLQRRYEPQGIDFTDALLPPRAMGEILNGLNGGEGEGIDLRFAGMVRPDIGKDRIERLAASGFETVLPGIESFSDSFLRLINKGVSAAQNVALLKNCAAAGIKVSWNLLYGAPGETDAHYIEQLELLPKITHLHSPTGAFGILYARDSCYVLHADEYGLDLEPLAATRIFCPEDEAYVRDVATFFADRNAPEPTPERMRLRHDLIECCQTWSKAYHSNAARLDMVAFDDELIIFDTRKCRLAPTHSLRGVDRELYLLAEQPIAWDSLLSQLEGAYFESEVDAALERLSAANLLVSLSGCYLALAVPMNFGTFMTRYALRRRR